MSRSSKVPLPMQDESAIVQEQLSLFTGNPVVESSEQAEVKMPPKAKKQTNMPYTAADIQVLEGIAAIRHRPGMYIGSTSTSGLLHLIWEALDNAVDEAVAGFGKHIWVRIDREGWVTVRDEG